MQWFERHALEHEPDFKIGHDPDDPYLLRWFITPRDPERGGIYLHKFLKSDDDRALHDHPWPSESIVLSGYYTEHFMNFQGEQLMRDLHAGMVLKREAGFTHRIEVISPGFTLFHYGPRTREWGFHCKQGWRHWTRFCDPTDKGKIGIGCGEFGDPEVEKTPLETIG